jgi:putative FmdB family regulatory protein
MPTYEYICRDCHKIFSVVTSIKDHEKNPRPPCEHCGSKNVDSFFSGATIITSKKS